MRPTTLLFALFLLIAPAASAQPHLPESLTTQDIRSELRPVTETIERCYLDRTQTIRGAGRLELTLNVRATGEIDTVALAITTPGLSFKVAGQIDECVRAAVAPLAFPARRTATTATLPYFFQRTAARNAGPLLSCYSASGCRDR